jgi:hypothetical protein
MFVVGLTEDIITLPTHFPLGFYQPDLLSL